MFWRNLWRFMSLLSLHHWWPSLSLWQNQLLYAAVTQLIGWTHKLIMGWPFRHQLSTSLTVLGKTLKPNCSKWRFTAPSMAGPNDCCMNVWINEMLLLCFGVSWWCWKGLYKCSPFIIYSECTLQAKCLIMILNLQRTSRRNGITTTITFSSEIHFFQGYC